MKPYPAVESRIGYFRKSDSRWSLTNSYSGRNVPLLTYMPCMPTRFPAFRYVQRKVFSCIDLSPSPPEAPVLYNSDCRVKCVKWRIHYQYALHSAYRIVNTDTLGFAGCLHVHCTYMQVTLSLVKKKSVAPFLMSDNSQMFWLVFEQ